MTAPASKGAKKVKAKAPVNQSRWSKGEEDHDPDVEQIVRFPPLRTPDDGLSAAKPTPEDARAEAASGQRRPRLAAHTR